MPPSAKRTESISFMGKILVRIPPTRQEKTSLEDAFFVCWGGGIHCALHAQYKLRMLSVLALYKKHLSRCFCIVLALWDKVRNQFDKSF